MADEEQTFAVGDVVELVDAPDSDDPMPWPGHAGKRGVVHYVPPVDDTDDPNIIVLFDDPAFPGVTTRRHHFRKVE